MICWDYGWGTPGPVPPATPAPAPREVGGVGGDVAEHHGEGGQAAGGVSLAPGSMALAGARPPEDTSPRSPKGS